MPYILPERKQLTFLPNTIEDYVPEDDPVRAYDSIINKIFKELSVKYNPNKAGAWEYDPQAMIKLIVYGYSYGIRSSRKLERAVHHNMSFIWLTGGLKPDYRTIARFRAENTALLKDTLKKCVHVCMKLNLIEGNYLFIDGSQFRANASINNTWDEEKCKKYLKKVHKHIEQLLEESERIDSEEENQESYVKLKEEINNQEKLINKINNILEEIKEKEVRSINTIDNNSIRAKSRQGTHASYNSQIAVDGKNGLIVNCEAVSQNNDYNQFTRQVLGASKNIGKMPEVACTDSGYSSIEDLKKLEKELVIVVPTAKQIANKESQKFSKENFKYNKEKDEYICPAGKSLKFERINSDDPRKKEYQASKNDCHTCSNYKECTNSKTGRKLIRLVDEEIKEKIEAIYKSEAGQKIYKERNKKVELVFGHFKRNLAAGQFMLRGKKKVDGELSILSTCFNIARMITLVGMPKLLNSALAQKK